MSSAVISTTAATGRPFVFDEESEPAVASLASASQGCRASLDRTAEGGCPHMSLQEAQESVIARILQSTIKNQQSAISPIGNRKSAIGNSLLVTPASRLEIRPAPEMVSSGIPALDALTGGLPRGCLTEICGPASSGRTTLLLAALAAATRRGEFCAVVDASDALDPQSAGAAGVELDRLLWVRCGENSPERRNTGRKKTNLVSRSAGCPILAAHFAARACPELAEGVGISSQAKFNFGSKENRMKENLWDQSEHSLEKVLRATDLLLESGGFGLIALDLGDLPSQAARRIPLTTWFRFRRAVEHTPTILLVIEPQAIAGSCFSLLLQLGSGDPLLQANGSAAKQQKNAAHGASRGFVVGDDEAPEGWKKIFISKQSNIDPQNANPAHTQLLTELDITAELIRSRIERKPARSVTFESKTAWAG